MSEFVDPNNAGVPDALVSLRQFVGGLDRVLNDQSYASADGLVLNRSGQFYAVGPNGVAVEGQPISVTSTGGLRLSSGMVMLGLGAVAVWLLTRKG